jgi:SOS-response transcriptional repressor LexA
MMGFITPILCARMEARRMSLHDVTEPLSELLRKQYLDLKDTADRVTLNEVARRIGFSQSYVTGLMQGAADRAVAKWAGEKAFQLFAAFKFTTSEVREIAVAHSLDNVLTHLDLQRVGRAVGVRVGGDRVKFLGSVSAGRFGAAFADDNGDTVTIPEQILRHHDVSDIFALEIDGDSMASDEARGRIPPGAIAYFHARLRPSPGQIVCCRLEADDTSVIKVYQPSEKFATLESLNRKHRPIVVDDSNPASIEGVLIGVTIPF